MARQEEAEGTLDVRVQDEGSVVMLRPLTPEAKQWLQDHADEDAIWMGGALAVGHQYADEIIQGLQDEGFTVSAGPEGASAAGPASWVYKPKEPLANSKELDKMVNRLMEMPEDKEL